MSAQEGPINCHYCNKRQNAAGRCAECAESNGLNAVITFRWVRNVYLTINDKDYLVSFSHISETARITRALENKIILEVPASANITLQNIKDKLKTYLLFL